MTNVNSKIANLPALETKFQETHIGAALDCRERQLTEALSREKETREAIKKALVAASDPNKGTCTNEILALIVKADRIAAAFKPASTEDPLEVTCWSCGKVYSLHIATVCPECYAWPRKQDQPPGPRTLPPRVGPKMHG